jgi:hypothetical protein
MYGIVISGIIYGYLLLSSLEQYSRFINTKSRGKGIILRNRGVGGIAAKGGRWPPLVLSIYLELLAAVSFEPNCTRSAITRKRPLSFT